MIIKQTYIINSKKYLNQICKYLATFALIFSKKFTSNQLSSFKSYRPTVASLKSFM